MEPSVVVVLNSGEAEGVPAIPVIVAEDKTGTQKRIAQIETDLAKKEDKKVWVRKLYKEITEETSALITTEDGVSFNQAERIRVVITFQEAFNNNITVTAVAPDVQPSINTFASGNQGSGVRTVIDFIDDPLITGSGGNNRDSITLQSFNTSTGQSTRDMLKLQTIETEDIITISLVLGAAISSGNIAVYALETPTEATE